MRTTIVSLALLLLVIPTVTDAGYPSGLYSSSQIMGNAPGAFVCPAGDGPSFSSQGFYFEAMLRDDDDLPVVGFPWPDEAIYTASESQDVCGNWVLILPDGPSDGNGRITFSGPIVGGGQSDYPFQVLTPYSGMLPVVTLLGPEYLVSLNSPDISGDGVVDLVDVAEFSLDYGTNATRSDFTWDGIVNLADLARLALHYGHTCD